MSFFIAAATVAFFALVLLIAGSALHKQNARFQNNKRHTRAEVVGYKCSSQSNYSTLLVRIPELNDGQNHNCESGKINKSDYPIGSLVDIWYAARKMVGIDVVEVYLYSNPPADSTKTARAIVGISIILFAIAGILTVAGFVTLL